MNPKAATLPQHRAQLPAATYDYCLRQGILKLLAVKDSDVRLLSLEQCRDAVDKSLHAGGAFSATIPLVSLYYGGFMAIDVADPTRRGQDLFVLSKGHAVAALASIYAELGYFDRSVLRNSRSYTSILNGHPGPVLPGVHVATGPMGQGLAVAQGFAIAGRWSPRFDSYCLTGDGELQEGPIWEAVMYAGQKHLDNFCVLVDRNNGQLDIANRMVFPMPELERVFESFDWHVHSVDATQYDGVYAALEAFKFGPRNGKPTAIICHGTKGHGALSDFLNKHKVTVPDATLQTEIALQGALRQERVDEFNAFYRSLAAREDGEALAHALVASASAMHLDAARSVWRRPVARRRRRPGGYHTRPEATEARALRPGAPPPPRSGERVCGERRGDGGHESLRTGSVGHLDRFGPGHDERPRSGRGSGRSAPGPQRGRRRGKHDGPRGSVRGPGPPDLDQHVLSVLRLEGAAADCRRPPGAARSDGLAGWLARRGPWPRSDDAGHGGELRDAHERRDAHGQRRCDDLRRHRPPADCRRLVPAANAVAHEVDDGGQSRAAVRARDAHAVGRDLRQRLRVRDRPGPRAARERRGPGGDRQQRPWRARGHRCGGICASEAASAWAS